jgi:hypothetical protein
VVLKWQAEALFFQSFRCKIGILRGIPQTRCLATFCGGSTVSFLLVVIGFGYVVLFLGFWSLGRMSALSDKLVENRANVMPFRRG